MSPRPRKKKSASNSESTSDGKVIIDVGKSRAEISSGRNLVGESTTDAPLPEIASRLAEMFLEIDQRIDGRADDEAFDKDELKAILANIEREVRKGDAAHPTKLERWLGYLYAMAPDIFDLTATVLLDPIFHLPRFAGSIIQRIKKN